MELIELKDELEDSISRLRGMAELLDAAASSKGCATGEDAAALLAEQVGRVAADLSGVVSELERDGVSAG